MEAICFRFDLIFLILDPQDELYDRKLAKHLVSLYYQGADDVEQENIVRLNYPPLSSSLPPSTKYISFPFSSFRLCGLSLTLAHYAPPLYSLSH